jgi:Ca-activated chloride channel family protein
VQKRGGKVFEFAWPWLLFLLPLPWLVRWLLPSAPDAKQSRMRVPLLSYMSRALEGEAHSHTHQAMNVLPMLLATLAWAFLLASAARPQWLGEPVPQPMEGRDIMMAVDLSESMKEEDFEFKGRYINRLMATKVVAGDFIQRRKGDQIGLILFGEEAYLQAPLTRDRATVRHFLDESQIGLAGQSTAIGDAIGLAVKRFVANDTAQRILILLTDGTNTAGALDPLEAAQLAAEEQVKIYTIGIGRGADSLMSMVMRMRGMPEIDETTLKAIAEKTGGQYFRAHDLEQLTKIYALLDEMEPVAQEDEYFRPVVSLYQWPLLGATVCLAALALVRRRLGA